MNLPKQKTVKIIIFFCLLMLPVFAQARGLVPCGGDGEKICDIYDMFYGVAKATNFLIAGAGILAVYQIVSGGFWLVISMGNEESITKHRNTITQAVVGFVFVMLAFMLVNTAANLILAQGNPDCQINLRNPFAYIINAPTCHK